MRQRRLQTASIAILAALVLGTGVASTDLTASANSRSQANPPWMSTQLQPGWNMVGWVGPETASRRLFAELPALQRISAWDAEQRRYRRAWRDQDEELPALTPGMGLWLLIGGDAPVQWRRPIALEGAKLRLRPGLNLVGWTGDDGTPVGEALDRLGNSVSVAWVWDAGSGQYTSYTLSAAGAARTQLALSRGDALWIHVSEPAEWRQPGSADPPVVFLGEIPAYIKMSIVAEYENVQTFFAERFGVEPKAPLSMSAPTKTQYASPTSRCSDWSRRRGSAGWKASTRYP